MLIRLLVLVGLAVVAWMLLKRFLTPPRQSRTDEDQGENQYRRMVACTRCGLHVPADEALTRGGASYCCRAHLPE